MPNATDPTPREVVTNFYAAYAKGDLATLRRSLAVDVVWTQCQGFPGGGNHHGVDAVIEAIARGNRARWRDFTAELHETLVDGERVVVLGAYRGVHAVTARPMHAVFAHVYAVRAGRIVRFEQIADTAPMVAAAQPPAAAADRAHTADLEFSGLRTRVVVPGAATGRVLTVLEISVDAGAGAPPHRSLAERKWFRVLDGRFRFRRDDRVVMLQSGDWLDVAAGAVHAFHNDESTPGRLLLVATPGLHDEFFSAMAALPVPHDWSEVQRVAMAHRQELLADQADVAPATEAAAP